MGDNVELKIDRYELDTDDSGYGQDSWPFIVEKITPDGEWVKYTDVVALLFKLDINIVERVSEGQWL